MDEMKQRTGGSESSQETVSSGFFFAVVTMPPADPSGPAVVHTKASRSVDKLIAVDWTYDDMVHLSRSKLEGEVDAVVDEDYTRLADIQEEIEEEKLSRHTVPVILPEVSSVSVMHDEHRDYSKDHYIQNEIGTVSSGFLCGDYLHKVKRQKDEVTT
jgi:hypothetical protein